MPKVRLAVRKVVEHTLRSGDIDNRSGGGGDSMLEGARAHRAIQKTMGPEYQREVTLRTQVEMAGIPVLLHGRADGVFRDETGLLTVDEIKTTTLPLEHFYEQRELHMGQAKCYAWMLLHEPGCTDTQAAVQLTYYHLETQELRRFQFSFSQEELEAFFQDLAARYGVWLRFEAEWRETRDDAIRETDFPFPTYRRGQRELAVAAYRAVEHGRKLYAQAPTGIGKTLSALFPSVKALGEGRAEKLFYLTAKTVTRTVAEDAVRRMARGGLRLKSVTLRAKDKICPQEETICNPDHCPVAAGHYDRVNDALLDLLRENDLITPAEVSAWAALHRVCPHELALDATLWADLIICDYNHVFDPRVYLKRFFADGGGDYVFLIDEAHNLPDRVRDMYTQSLRKSDYLHLKRELRDKNAPAARLRGALGRVNAFLLDARKACGDAPHRVVREHPAPVASGEAPPRESDTAVLAALLLLFTAAAEEWMAVPENAAHPLYQEVLEQYFAAMAFAALAEQYDHRFATISERHGSDLIYTLYCLDPSAIIGEKLGLARASILFSATLTPLPYFREMLGGGEEDRAVALPSPFPPERLLLLAHCGISTKYAHREASTGPLAEAIHLAVSRRRGNYLIFFPSHAYLRAVHEEFTRRFPEVETLVQKDHMDEDARAAFLARFDADNASTLAGFCVLGGIFSEGIDLAGERLIGAVVVGVGLPGISLRQDLIREYFNEKNGRGFDYAYVYPGMNKVLQAAGRVIRTETDAGLVLLIDSRFGTRGYRELFPAHWADMHFVHNLPQLQELVDGFSCWEGEDAETAT